jgi:hypothetical protein
MFLEEVNLPPEFAFRLDNNSDKQLLSKEATSLRQKSSFFPAFYRDNMLGATEEYKLKNRMFAFRCKPPPGIDEEGNTVDPNAQESSPGPSSSSLPKPPSLKRKSGTASSLKPLEYMNLEKPGGGRNSTKDPKRLSFKNDSEAKVSAELNVREKTEFYNSELRKDSKNTNLWKAFVQFQDQVFETEGLRHEDGKKKTKKVYGKQLIQKKIAILEKAVGKSTSHFQRNKLNRTSNIRIKRLFVLPGSAKSQMC